MTTISLPIIDRQRAHDFYTDGLGLTPVGPLGDDNLPEPLRYDIDGTSVLLIPTGGFDWAIDGRQLAHGDPVGCLITLAAKTDGEVDQIFERAVNAGATAVVAPKRQPWGMYAATFADPDGNVWMTTSTPLPSAAG